MSDEARKIEIEPAGSEELEIDKDRAKKLACIVEELDEAIKGLVAEEKIKREKNLS